MKTFIETLLTLATRETVRESTGPTQRRGSIFVTAWEGLTINKVEIRGIVIGSHAIGSSGFQVSIDDGTGRISAVSWISESDSMGSTIHNVYNKFVSAKGTLVGFRTEIQLKVDSLTVIAQEEEATEEGLWWLDVKDEWENLASSSRSDSKADVSCPCLCHSGSNIPCRCLGSPSVWSPAFNRGVILISSALRTVTPSGLSMSDLVKLVQESCTISPTLQSSSCLADCGTVEAMRQLLREGYATRIGDTGRFRIVSKLEAPIELDHQRFSRYPESQLGEDPDECLQPIEPPKPRSKPKFISACDAFPS